MTTQSAWTGSAGAGRVPGRGWFSCLLLLGVFNPSQELDVRGTIQVPSRWPTRAFFAHAVERCSGGQYLGLRGEYLRHGGFDLAPAVSTTAVLAVHPSVSAPTVKDLLALIKTNPGKYYYATAGVGSPGHLVGEMLRQSFDLDLVHIPYNTGLAIGSTVAGQTRICLAAPAPIVLQARTASCALAVAYRTRLRALAEVPTMAEAGYPGIEFDNWFGVFVPAGTSGEIITHLNREIAKSMALPNVEDRLVALGFEPVASTPEEFATQIKIELEKWAKVIRAANIKAQ